MNSARGLIVFFAGTKFLKENYPFYVRARISYQAFTLNLSLPLEEFTPPRQNLLRLIRQSLNLVRFPFYQFHQVESGEYACIPV